MLSKRTPKIRAIVGVTEFEGKPKKKTLASYDRMRIMTLVRRWLLIWALMFWQGGLMFYGGVVVPVGGAVLGSERQQGFITRSVTNYLNSHAQTASLRPHLPS
jgi:hypothetical protein